MPILIRDETANATVLTIDNNGNLAFADGTPINMLTLAGYGIIDSEGYIVHGFGSNAVLPNAGVVSVPTNNFNVTIPTVPGVVPTATVDASYPAVNHSLVGDPGNPDAPLTRVDTPVMTIASHSVRPFPGGFVVAPNGVALDTRLIEPGSDYYDADLAAGVVVGYRWI